MAEDWPADAFFELHKDLPREGPGDPADIAWATSLGSLPPDGTLCDAACGPGADLGALAASVPEGRVIGFDRHGPFVEAAAKRHEGNARVEVVEGQLIRRDQSGLPDPHDLGPFDLIWCAGACYFEGVTDCLEAWKPALKPGGLVAFSEVAWFVEDPASEVRAFWEDYPAMTTEAGIARQIAAAGYDLLGTRRLSDAAWKAYYEPLSARAARLRSQATPELARVLDAGDEEARMWQTYKAQFGYVLSVVRPQ